MSGRAMAKGRVRVLASLAVVVLFLFWGAPVSRADQNEGSPPVRPFEAVASAGSLHQCAVLGTGSVKCWGWNAYGQLGLGDVADRGDSPGEMGENLPAIDLGAGRTATAIAAGDFHTCALLDNGTVKCWGHNGDGELGLGDYMFRGDGPGEMGDNLPAVALGTGRTATGISAGTGHTCALLDNGTVKCWGFNYYGQLGLGDTADRGGNPGDLGDNLPAVDLGTGRTAVAISAANLTSCALLDNGTVKCWGANFRGQLGQGDTRGRGDDPGEMGDNLPAIALGTGRTATAITAGHLCALLDNGSVKCWGQNNYLSYGETGSGDTTVRGDDPGEMGDNLPAVPLGTGRTASAISASGSSTCALLDNSAVKCWGRNDAGQLGLGDTADRGDDPGEMGDNLPAIALGTGRTATAVISGDSSSCALLDNGTVKCWGVGAYLGLGDTANRGDDPGEMGDNLSAVNLGIGVVVGPTFTTTTTTTTTSTSTTLPGVASDLLYTGSVVPPSEIAIGSAYAVETAQRVNVFCAGSISGVWWYRTSSDTGLNTVSVWRSGVLVGQGSAAPSTTGWVYAALASPVTVVSGDQLVVGVHHPNGAYAYALNGFAGRSVVSASACMTAPATAPSAKNGLYDYTNTPVQPSLSYAASEYFITPELRRGTPPLSTTTTTPTTTTPTTTVPNGGGERLYPASVVPSSSIAIGPTYSIETAQRINLSCSGTVNGLWWYRTDADTGPQTISLWRSGALLGSASASPTSVGWVYAAFPAPVPVASGDGLIVGVHHPNGAYATAVNGFLNRSVTSASGCMTAPASTAGAPNGLYDYSATAVLPTLSYAASEYFITPDLTSSSSPSTTTTTTTTTTTPVAAGSDRLYAATVTPPSVIAIGPTYAVETAQRVSIFCAGTLNGVWWYRTAADTGPNTVSIWRSGTLIGSATGSPTSTGWVYVALSSPANVSSGDQLTIGVHHPNGAYAYALNGFNGRSVTSATGCLLAPATTAVAPNGVYDYTTTPKLPALSYASSEYFITPDFTPRQQNSAAQVACEGFGGTFGNDNMLIIAPGYSSLWTCNDLPTGTQTSDVQPLVELCFAGGGTSFGLDGRFTRLVSSTCISNKGLP